MTTRFIKDRDVYDIVNQLNKVVCRCLTAATAVSYIEEVNRRYNKRGHKFKLAYEGKQ